MAGMAFVQWIARMSSQAAITPIAPVLVSGLLKYTRENEGAVGLVPEIFRKDLSIVEGLFEQLRTQPPNVKTYIQESLCTMLDAFQPMKGWATEDDTQRILSIIEANTNKDEHQARFCAVKYANALFPFSDISSKYVCLMTVADEKLEIREEAKRGLTFPTARALEENSAAKKESMLPDFVKLLEMITVKSRSSQTRTEELHLKPTFGKAFIMGFPSEIFIHMLQFFRRLTKVKAWLKNMWELDNQIDNEQKTLSRYIFFLETALNHQGPQDKSLHSTALTCLLELFSLAPSGLSQQYANRLGWFK
ncbi:hypothetical protein BGX26_007180, partial [Mortierella sp. AD094]